MKITIAKNIIENALSVAAAYTDPKDANASSVFMRGADNTLVFEATNFTESIRVKNVPCAFDTLGAEFEKIAIDGKKLLSIVKSYKNADIILEIKDEEILVRQNRSRFKLSVMSENALKNIEFNKGDKKLELNKEIIKGLEALSHATDSNNPNYALNGTLMSFKDKGIALVGTDTRRLAGMRYENNTNIKGLDVIIPKQGVHSLGKLYISDKVELYLSDTTLVVEDEKIEYSIRLINAKFPDWERIVPKKVSKQFQVNIDNLKELIAQASIVNTEATVKIEKGELSITARDDKNDTYTNGFQVTEEVDGVKFSVNLKFITDFLNESSGKEITLFYNETNAPFMVRNASGLIEVIMPIVDFDNEDAEPANNTDSSVEEAA